MYKLHGYFGCIYIWISFISWKYNMHNGNFGYFSSQTLRTGYFSSCYYIKYMDTIHAHIIYITYTHKVFVWVYIGTQHILWQEASVSCPLQCIYDRGSLWVRFTVNYCRRSRSSPAWVTKFLRFVSRDSPPQSRDEFRPTRVTGGGKTKSIAHTTDTHLL